MWIVSSVISTKQPLELISWQKKCSLRIDNLHCRLAMISILKSYVQVSPTFFSWCFVSFYRNRVILWISMGAISEECFCGLVNQIEWFFCVFIVYDKCLKQLGTSVVQPLNQLPILLCFASLEWCWCNFNRFTACSWWKHFWFPVCCWLQYENIIVKVGLLLQSLGLEYLEIFF